MVIRLIRYARAAPQSSTGQCRHGVLSRLRDDRFRVRPPAVIRWCSRSSIRQTGRRRLP